MKAIEIINDIIEISKIMKVDIEHIFVSEYTHNLLLKHSLDIVNNKIKYKDLNIYPNYSLDEGFFEIG